MDNSTPVGTWYLLANTSRLELTTRAGGGSFAGTIANEGGPQEPLDLADRGTTVLRSPTV